MLYLAAYDTPDRGRIERHVKSDSLDNAWSLARRLDNRHQTLSSVVEHPECDAVCNGVPTLIDTWHQPDGHSEHYRLRSARRSHE